MMNFLKYLQKCNQKINKRLEIYRGFVINANGFVWGETSRIELQVLRVNTEIDKWRDYLYFNRSTALHQL